MYVPDPTQGNGKDMVALNRPYRAISALDKFCKYPHVAKVVSVPKQAGDVKNVA